MAEGKTLAESLFNNAGVSVKLHDDGKVGGVLKITDEERKFVQPKKGETPLGGPPKKEE